MQPIKAIVDFVMDIFETVTFIGSFFIVTYLFIVQPNQIKGQSMVPTFENKQYILTSKVTYKFRAPERGDIVVFRSPQNKDIEYIKRIIGLPGDTIIIDDDTGQVSVNGVVLKENYINNKTNLFSGGAVTSGVAYKVPKGHYFVMGDNRQKSSDSRVFGAIKEEDIIGQVFYRYFPPELAGPIKNPFPQNLRGTGAAVSLPVSILQVRG